MADEVFLCISQKETVTPYKFKLTGINVYSIEEAAYHCYYHWKQSIDEFASPDFLDWLREHAGLPFLASKIVIIDQIKSRCDKLIAFFSLIDYFDEDQISNIRAQLTVWEKRREWERLKEQADYLFKKKEFARAVNFYKKAIGTEENVQLLNNLGVSYLSAGDYEEGAGVLQKALLIEPYNIRILLNLAEAYIYCHKFEDALEILGTAESVAKNNPDIPFLYGALHFESANIRQSIEYFERAIEMNADPHYIYRLVDVYAELRQFDKAIECVNRAPLKDKEYYITLASLHYVSGNVPAAIKIIERALVAYRNDVTLWTKLAYYHRLDYDVQKANSAIITAMAIDKENEHTLLEYARIKKAMGKTKDYQNVLRKLLAGFKVRYRESTGY